MPPKNAPVALFDMDNTLVDYHKVLRERLAEMRSPEESDAPLPLKEPPHMRARRMTVQRDPEFWRNLPPFQIGVDLWNLAGDLGFDRHILTQGPIGIPQAWSGKVESVQKHFGKGVPITITRNKGSYYGRVLVDDWPPYCEDWLAHRPRGLVILPSQPWNTNYSHPRVVRYDGMNLEEVRERLIRARDRQPGEPL